jgi:amino acid transporter
VYLYLGWGCTGVGTGYSAGVAVVYTTGSLTAVAAYSATVTAWNASGQSPPSTCFNTTTTNYPPPPNNAQPNWFVWVIFGSVFALFAYIGFDWADRWMRRNRKGRVKAP